MSLHKTDQYRAYVKAANTIAKTRQVVMIYDGVMRFLKQAATAIRENRTEDRFKFTSKSSEILVGLQSSIDFENGGDVATTLHNFYTNIFTRVLALNFNKNREDAERQCNGIIEELKQMRDVWDNIDRTLNTSDSGSGQTDSAADDSAASTSGTAAQSGVVLSA